MCTLIDVVYYYYYYFLERIAESVGAIIDIAGVLLQV